MDKFTKQESCKPYFENAFGYAVYETIGKIGVGVVGVAMGDGDVMVKNADGVFEKVGTSKMMQGSLGPQFGGQIYSMVIFFQTESDYKRFVQDNFEFGADINVVALTASASGKASTMDKNMHLSVGVKPTEIAFEQSTNTILYTKGLAVFTSTKGGLMYEASLSGQKYNFKAN
jgi:lipid-binding SYLF domain-containing protein